MGWLAGLFSLIGTGISGFFNTKQKQAEVIEHAMTTIQNVNTEDSNYAQAVATSVSALYQFGGILERSWRPLLMVYLIVLVSLCVFQIIMPADWIMIELMSLLKAGVYGYVPLRTTEKLTTMYLVSKTLNNAINKQVEKMSNGIK